MKKLLTGIISLTLAASMSLSAFAANTATNDGTAGTDITVNGKFQAGSAATEVISVDITWDDMSFTYTEGSKGIWNTKTHAYDNPTESGWAATNGTDPKITVTNHSNVEVNVLFTFSTDISGLNGSFTNDSLVLATAENTLPDNAPKGETAFSVSGSAIDADKALGTITVTVAKYVPISQTISTAEELLATANKNGIFVLANAIDLGTSRLDIASNYYVLDLNGHTISGNVTFEMINSTGGSITIKNGTVENTSTDYGSGIAVYSDTFLLENCNLAAFSAALDINRGTSCVTDCDIQISSPEHVSFHSAGDLTLSGQVNVSGGVGFIRRNGTVKALPGTYNFDVSSYVDTTLYDVTNDGTTWTVTAK